VTAGRDPDDNRWREIDRIFSAALDRPPEDRMAFVEEASGGDRELADAVAALLRAEHDSEGLFEAPGISASRELLEDLAGRGPEIDRIGRYTIVRELGRGGMGTVYLAEHEGEGFLQRVALKVLRRGVDTDDVLRRFVTERRILASLSHPNIARLQDGGATEDGRPYLVMEYVEGEPITDYCDRQRLTVRKRLELVLEVAEAVQAAHSRLVVHRDLKPSNILVTAEGRVKLLDFGIAKLLDPDTDDERTRTGVYLLTPDHASPEQLRGEAVTTTTDVYQLGVLLFRLLTGRKPYRATGAAAPGSATGLNELADRLDPPRASTVVASGEEADRIAADRDTIPSQLRRTLTGDLDTIIGKALQAEPERRYSSAADLAGDVRRFLEGRTISARPATLGYRTRKFLRRHPWVAPVVASVVAFVAIYIGTLVRHADQLEAQRNVARLEAERAREVQEFLVDLFASADPYGTSDPARSRDITVVEALDLGAERLKTSLTGSPEVRASILAAIARVYQNLGVSDRALPLREEALALQESLYGPASRQVRDSLQQLAAVREELGEQEIAAELRERRLDLALAAEPANPSEVATARIGFGRSLMSESRPEEAEAQFQAVIALAEDGGVPPSDLAEAFRSLADVQGVLGRPDESLASARRAVAMFDEVEGGSSVRGALARGTLAQTLFLLGGYDEADAHYRAAIEGLERTLGPDHIHRLATLSNFAVLRMNQADYAGADELLAEIVRIGERVYGPEHPSVGAYLQNRATALVGLERLDEARAVYERAAEIYRGSLARDNYRRGLPMLSLSRIDLRQDRPEAAEASAREALEVLAVALPEGHYITAVAKCRLAMALAGQGRADEAVPLFERSAASLIETEQVPEYRRECLAATADFYRASGDLDAAARLDAVLQRSDGRVTSRD